MIMPTLMMMRIILMMTTIMMILRRLKPSRRLRIGHNYLAVLGLSLTTSLYGYYVHPLQPPNVPIGKLQDVVFFYVPPPGTVKEREA